MRNPKEQKQIDEIFTQLKQVPDDVRPGLLEQIINFIKSQQQKKPGEKFGLSWLGCISEVDKEATLESLEQEIKEEWEKMD